MKPGLRLPIRISIDHEALAALDKRALAANIGIGVVAGWLASWLVGGTGLLRYVLYRVPMIRTDMPSGGGRQT